MSVHPHRDALFDNVIDDEITERAASQAFEDGQRLDYQTRERLILVELAVFTNGWRSPLPSPALLASRGISESRVRSALGMFRADRLIPAPSPQGD